MPVENRQGTNRSILCDRQVYENRRQLIVHIALVEVPIRSSHSQARDPIRASSERLLRVNGRNYSANIVAGGFRLYTGPSLLCLADFASRPQAAIQLLLRPQNLGARCWSFAPRQDDRRVFFVLAPSYAVNLHDHKVVEASSEHYPRTCLAYDHIVILDV
jgi:hypothetical protein